MACTYDHGAALNILVFLTCNQKLLPRHMKLIYDINLLFLRHVETVFPSDPEVVSKLSLIEENPRMVFTSL